MKSYPPTTKSPADDNELPHALQLFVARQFDAYFAMDDRFAQLRLAYDAATPAMQANVREAISHGDPRCLDFFGVGKPLGDCSRAELELVIDVALQNQDWPRLFRAFLAMPLHYGFPLIEYFRASGGHPRDPQLRRLHDAVLQASDDEISYEHESLTLLERWIDAGRSSELVNLEEAQLLRLLRAAAPPEGVRLVAALAVHSVPGGSAAQSVAHNEHWMIRLAGYATGLCVRVDKANARSVEENFWLRELVRSAAALDFWPEHATPADLDRLNHMPREAFIGKMGAVRRVLRLLLAQRITAAEVEPFVAPPLEAAEFLEAL